MGLSRCLKDNLLASAGVEGDIHSIPRSGWSPEEGNDNALQYSCLENPMDNEAGQATVHGITEQTWLSDWVHSLLLFVSLINNINS